MMPHQLRRIGVDYYLCANGATVYDAAGATLRSVALQRDDIMRVIEAVSPLDPGWNVFCESTCFIERSAMSYMTGGVRDLRNKIRAHLPRSRKAFRVILVTLKNHFFGEQGKRIVHSINPIVVEHDEFEKIGCSFRTAEACDEAACRIEELGDFEVARVWARELEITAAGATKGLAADWLLDHLGVERERTVAFGDSMNDAPLIGHVGKFVAMGNGSDEVKALADEVCGTLVADGVATWLEEQMEEAKGRA